MENSKDKRKIHYSSKCISDFKSDINFVADAIAEQIHRDNFPAIVTLNDCVQYFHNESKKLPNEKKAAGFILTIKKNPDPYNENDFLIIIQGLVDENKKPIIVNGETISRILHTRTIDHTLICALDGKDSGLFMM